VRPRELTGNHCFDCTAGAGSSCGGRDPVVTALCRRDPTHKTPRQSEAATAVAG